jgi:hypothetical protein
VAAIAKTIAIAAVVALAVVMRRVNRRWFSAVASGQPAKARALRGESRVADAVLVVMVVVVSLGILGS